MLIIVTGWHWVELAMFLAGLAVTGFCLGVAYESRWSRKLQQKQDVAMTYRAQMAAAEARRLAPAIRSRTTVQQRPLVAPGPGSEYRERGL